MCVCNFVEWIREHEMRVRPQEGKLKKDIDAYLQAYDEKQEKVCIYTTLMLCWQRSDQFKCGMTETVWYCVM